MVTVSLETSFRKVSGKNVKRVMFEQDDFKATNYPNIFLLFIIITCLWSRLLQTIIM